MASRYAASIGSLPASALTIIRSVDLGRWKLVKRASTTRTGSRGDENIRRGVEPNGSARPRAVRCFEGSGGGRTECDDSASGRFRLADRIGSRLAHAAGFRMHVVFGDDIDRDGAKGIESDVQGDFCPADPPRFSCPISSG